MMLQNMDPFYCYKVPSEFFTELKNNPVTSEYFVNINENKFHSMISHMFTYIFKESLSVEDFEILFDAHKDISINDELIKAWIDCFRISLEKTDLYSHDIAKILQKAMYITKRLIKGPCTPKFMIENLLNDIKNKTNDQIDKAYILKRLTSLKDILDSTITF
jgi:hypothetical protein